VIFRIRCITTSPGTICTFPLVDILQSLGDFFIPCGIDAFIDLLVEGSE